MEKRGVPTCVVNTEPFISSSIAMAVAHGMADYPFVVIPHPIAATKQDVLETWADDVIDDVIRILSPQTSALHHA